MIEMLLVLLIQAYIVILFIRGVLSYLPSVDRRNPLVQFIHDVTEPVLKPVRQRVGLQNGIDFSPIIVFIGLYILLMVVTQAF